MIKIPVYKPFLNGNEKKYVNDCLDTTWISSKGKYVDLFEKEFSKFIDVKHSVTVANGTVALHLALEALGIKEGDEVIVPTFTYIASVNSIIYTGATPIFVDSCEETWQISPEDIKKKITNKTKAIMAVHLYGHPCEMDTIMQIAKDYGLYVIEDCAEAFGSQYKGKFVGTFGDISTFSFFGNKTITTGEGGMVVTNDETLYERAMHLKGQGLAKWREYWHDIVGYNYRMTNICAAIGLAQLEQANDFINKKRQLANWYKEGLKGLNLYVQPEAEGTLNTYWMVTISLNDYAMRDRLREYLKDKGIETRPTFYPVHTMPMFAKSYERHTVAEKLARSGMNLPSYPELSKEEVELVCKEIRGFFNENN